MIFLLSMALVAVMIGILGIITMIGVEYKLWKQRKKN